MKSEIERASHAECDALNAQKRCIKLHKVVYHIHYRVWFSLDPIKLIYIKRLEIRRRRSTMVFHVMLCLLCGNSSSHDSLDFIFHFLNVHSNEVKKEKKRVVNCHIYIRIHMNMFAIKREKTLSYMMILHAKDILLIAFAGQ